MVVVLHVGLDFLNDIITGINTFCLQKFCDIHKKLVVIIFQFLQRKDVIDHILDTVGGLWCFLFQVIIQDITALSGKIIAVWLRGCRGSILFCVSYYLFSGFGTYIVDISVIKDVRQEIALRIDLQATHIDPKVIQGD